MAGITHVAFRQILERFGGHGLSYTEMCSARAISHGQKEQHGYFRWTEEERSHLVCQIMGGRPEDLARAAEVIQDLGFFGVDINMGCSVSRICSQGAGAALLREPGRASAAVSAVRKAVSCPVLVKFRTGWTDDPGSAADMARRFEDAGADGMIFHPRVAPDRRSRPPKWDHIRHVVRAVSIPVFGNGNVVTAEDAAAMLESTGCAGVALGRIAAARPWIFAQLTRGYQPSPHEIVRTAVDLAGAIWSWYPPHIALRLFRTFTAYFCANFAFGHALRPRLCSGQSLSEIQDGIAANLTPCPRLLTRPNALMFNG
jgi:nifR3 family TIM-barrel protein